MSSISTVTREDLTALEQSVKQTAAQRDHLEDVAQGMVSAVFDRHETSLALARVYATIPYAALPPGNRAFVDKLCDAKGVKRHLRETTPILSLIGTRGTNAPWNDRRLSEGHVGIPLLTTSFVESIPMVARLLIDLGVDLEWVDRSPSDIFTHVAGASGVFYVQDAATAVDPAGRKVIPAQDFVATNKVKTVFGVGTTYVNGTLAVLILFTRETLTREQTERFLPLIKTFRTATTAAVVQRRRVLREASQA